MRTVLTINEVLRAFVKKSQDEARTKNNSLFFINSGLYSWLLSYPLAVWLNSGTERILINGDITSQSTTNHRWALINILKEEIDIPFTVLSKEALENALSQVIGGMFKFAYMLNPDCKMEVIDSTPSDMDWISASSEAECEEKVKEFQKKFTSIIIRKAKDASEYTIQGHKAESSLLKYTHEGKAYYILNSFDGAAFFSAILARPCTSVEDAFESLKPPEVQEAMDKREVLRQGEWFFVKVAEPGEAKEVIGVPDSAFRVRALPPNKGANSWSNRHECRIYESPDGLIYCTGRVFHRRYNGLASGEHASVKLNGYYIAYHNTAIHASTSTSRVD